MGLSKELFIEQRELEREEGIEETRTANIEKEFIRNPILQVNKDTTDEND